MPGLWYYLPKRMQGEQKLYGTILLDHGFKKRRLSDRLPIKWMWIIFRASDGQCRSTGTAVRMLFCGLSGVMYRLGLIDCVSEVGFHSDRRRESTLPYDRARSALPVPQHCFHHEILVPRQAASFKSISVPYSAIRRCLI